MLPYFRRSEDYERRRKRISRRAAASSSVSDLRNDHPYCEAWVAAGVEAACRATPISTARRTYGVGAYQLSIRSGWRCELGQGIPAPARAARNLTVMTGAQVTRVLFEGDARNRRRMDRGRRARPRRADPR